MTAFKIKYICVKTIHIDQAKCFRKKTKQNISWLLTSQTLAFGWFQRWYFLYFAQIWMIPTLIFFYILHKLSSIKGLFRANNRRMWWFIFFRFNIYFPRHFLKIIDMINQSKKKKICVEIFFSCFKSFAKKSFFQPQ
jgi:hypothetical protein